MSLSTLTHRRLIQLTSQLVPPLLSRFHKGTPGGRIAVIGGCEDYTGAPFFSAHASAMMGADLVHVICETQAAGVIKSYSPDLMVHPYLYSSETIPSGRDENDILTKLMEKVNSVLARVHVVVLGPGLGRDPLLLKTVEVILKGLKERGIPIVIDADALFLIAQKPHLVAGYKQALLTPNVMEFKRLSDAVGLELNPLHNSDVKIQEEEVLELSKKLQVGIIRKGGTDIIVYGNNAIHCSVRGSNKRSGGQGDTLTGTIATLLAWGEGYKERIWDHSGEIKEEDISILAAYGGSTVTRTASQLAFAAKGRAMQASDVGKEVGRAYSEVFGAATG